MYTWEGIILISIAQVIFFFLLWTINYYFLSEKPIFSVFYSSHPYIFFNQDRITMTFIGFHIDRKGNLLDPERHIIIQPNFMTRHLRTGLFVQKVDMETNYESWSK